MKVLKEENTRHKIKKEGNLMGIFNDLFSNSNEEFEVGDKVRVKYRDQEGYIISKIGDLYMVSINNGQIVESYTASDLGKCW